jgi:hypothetical protein
MPRFQKQKPEGWAESIAWYFSSTASRIAYNLNVSISPARREPSGSLVYRSEALLPTAAGFACSPLTQPRRTIQDNRLFFEDRPRNPHANRIRTRRKYRCQAADFPHFLPRQSVCLLLQLVAWRGRLRRGGVFACKDSNRAGIAAQPEENACLAAIPMRQDDRESLVRNL